MKTIKLGKYEAEVLDDMIPSKDDFIEEILESVHEKEMEKYWMKTADWRHKRLDKLEIQLKNKELKITQ